MRTEDFVVKPVAPHHFVSAVRNDHPLAGRDLSLEEFLSLDHVLVAPTGTAVGFVDKALIEQGHERRIAYTTSSFLLALPIVMTTDCALTAPELLIRLMPEAFSVFRPPVEVPVFDLVMVWHPNWTGNSRHSFVRNRLMTAMSAWQDFDNPLGG